MKRRILVTAMLGMMAPVSMHAQSIEFIGQVGITAAQYTGDQIASSLEVQGALGFKIRGGGRFYGDAGAFWTRTGGTLTVATPVGPAGATSTELTLSSVRIPVTIGWRVLKTGILNLRLFAGTSINFISSVSDTNFGLETDDINSPLFNGRAGVGLDLAIIGIDLAYEFGLTDVFDDAGEAAGLGSVKQNGFVGEVGLRIGF